MAAIDAEMSFFDFSRKAQAGILPLMNPIEPRYFSEQVFSAQRFYLRLNPGERTPLTVISGGVEHCRPDYEINRDGFPHPIIEFVARGAGQLTLRGASHRLTAGTVFTYSRGLPHRIQCDPDQPLTKYFVVLSGEAGRELMRECRLSPGTVSRILHPEQIQQVFEDLIRHGRGDHPDRHRMCTVAVQYLIMKIGDLAAPCGDSASGAFATYQRCRRFIEEHYLSVQSLNEVALACHVDLAYLCRLFQRFGRERPFRYLQHLRLNRAAELIQNSDLMIKEVSDKLGFSDPYNFSRAFRRAFGVPPGHLRQGEKEGRKGSGFRKEVYARLNPDS
jgi:AraC-like DNA-binding protein